MRGLLYRARPLPVVRAFGSPSGRVEHPRVLTNVWRNPSVRFFEEGLFSIQLAVLRALPASTCWTHPRPAQVSGTLFPAVRTSAPPSLSVIVVAHTRREFLREAIESVLAQDLGKEEFELIVVRNFSDSDLDAHLASIGAESIVSPDLPLGPKLVEAIHRSHGEVLTFLDYDDMYDPSRLRRVRQAFLDHPDLGFYHNRFSYIGDDGHPLRVEEARAFRLPKVPARRTRFLSDREKWSMSTRLGGLFPDFNSSSAAVRRRVIEPAVPFLARTYVASDTFLFFSALAGTGSMLLDADALTRYRVHSGNSSSAGAGSMEARREKLLEFALRAGRDYEIAREYLVQACRGRSFEDIDARIWVNRLSVAFRSGNSHRRDFLHLLRDFPRFARTYPIQEDLWGIVGVAPFLISPSLGRSLYDRQIAGA